MKFEGFTNQDFDVFFIENLEPRMNAIKKFVRPKLEYIGQETAVFLSQLVQEEMYYHVAKHARRTKNPPEDTWVAWSNSKRGYKSLPHFQVGLWSTHLYVKFALIYEAPNKKEFALQLEKNIDDIYEIIPKDFAWSMDHTKPGVIKHEKLDKNELLNMAERLKNTKKAELLCGITIDRNDSALHNKDTFFEKIEETFTTLTPLFRLAKTV